MEECRVRHVNVFGRQLHPKGGVGGGRGGGFDVRTSRFDLLLSLGLVECFSRVSITFTNLFLKRIAFFKLISSLKPSLLKGPKDRGMTGMRATDMDGSYKSALGARRESVLGANGEDTLTRSFLLTASLPPAEMASTSIGTCPTAVATNHTWKLATSLASTWLSCGVV